MEDMPVAFYFLKLRGDGEAALNGVRKLKGAYEVNCAELVFGKYDMIVKISGATPEDTAKFWFDVVRKIEGVDIIEKCFSPLLPEKD